MTGTTWQNIRENFPTLVPYLLRKGVIFARMTPLHKQQVIEGLQSTGKYVGK